MQFIYVYKLVFKMNTHNIFNLAFTMYDHSEKDVEDIVKYPKSAYRAFTVDVNTSKTNNCTLDSFESRDERRRRGDYHFVIQSERCNLMLFGNANKRNKLYVLGTKYQGTWLGRM